MSEGHAISETNEVFYVLDSPDWHEHAIVADHPADIAEQLEAELAQDRAAGRLRSYTIKPLLKSRSEYDALRTLSAGGV